MSSAVDSDEWVLHVDMDQFVAAVEVRRRPELRGRPVVVGGDGDPMRARQVVSTASYEARPFGVRSGMPLRTALRRCPEAVFLPTDPPAYEAASAEVMAVLRSFPVVVEVWGWDEAFVAAHTDDPQALARELQRAVLDRTQLSCAVGIGTTKHQAKIAVQAVKPGGIGRLTGAEWPAVMGERATDALWGVGRRTADKLAELDVRTVSQLAAADADVLAQRFGPATGPWLRQLARGDGYGPVSAQPWVRTGRSHETTFATDLTDRTEVEAALAVLVRAVARDCAEDGRPVVRVTVKVRTSTFWSATRARKLPEPTADPDALVAAALDALGRFELDRPVRLLGVRAELAPPG